MIQIRQKRQQQRQSIRREYLDNHFKELRKKYFNYENGFNSSDNHNKSIFQILLKESLILNNLSVKFRESNLLEELNQLIDGAIQTKNMYETKFLLTIISNMFKDELNAYEKEVIFRVSFKLFESLNLRNLSLQNKQQKILVQKVCQKVGVEILMFYMVGANSISQYLDEQDQIKIQQVIYPAFLKILFWGFNNPEKLLNIEEIQKEVWNFLLEIFDLKSEIYEDGNRQKTHRLIHFFIEVMKEHQLQLKSNEVIYVCFPKVMSAFFWLYDFIIDQSSEIPDFFKSVEMLNIIDLTLKEEIKRQDEKCMKNVYSILRSFIDKKILLKQIQYVLQKKEGQENFAGFRRLMKSTQNKSVSLYRAVELLQSIVISFFEENHFRDLIKVFALDLVGICCDIIHNFDKISIGVEKDRIMMRRTITILKALIEKENVEGNEEGNVIFKHFQRNSGLKCLTVINEQLGDLDADEDPDINCILEDIEWISLQDLETPFSQENESY